MNSYTKTTQWKMLPDLMKQSLENDIMSKLSKEIADEIDREVLAEIHGEMLVRDGWHLVQVKDWSQITNGWCATHIKGNYHCYSHYWYFEESKDATFFTLKWQ